MFLQAALYGQTTAAGYSKGPFVGKNYYPVYTLFYSIPGISAGIEQAGTLTFSNSFYYYQDFIIKDYSFDELGKISDVDVGYDFEGCSFENSITYHLKSNLMFGVTTRFISYYGGFMDSFIESYHGVFGFPNAGREYSSKDQLLVDVETKNGITLKLTKQSVSIGDTDLFVKYNLYHNKFSDIAVFGALKIPTGSLASLSGSGYPDIAGAVLASVYPLKYFSFHIQPGVVVPINSFGFSDFTPYPMFQCIAALEISPHKYFSLIAQFNIKSSPLTGTFDHMNNIGMDSDFISYPQTNLLVGFVVNVKKVRFQLYFEEDTFTNAGNDWTLNLSLSYKIHTGAFVF